MSTKKAFLCSGAALFLSLLIWGGRQAHAQQDKAIVLDGIWRLRGYGKVLRIHEGTYANYDTTAISCVQEGKGTLSDLQERFDRFEIHDGAQLSPRVQRELCLLQAP